MKRDKRIKPTDKDIEKFNKSYEKIISKVNNLNERRLKLLSMAMSIDKYAKSIYDKSLDVLFYLDKNGCIKCTNRDITEKMKDVLMLIDYSIDF